MSSTSSAIFAAASWGSRRSARRWRAITSGVDALPTGSRNRSAGNSSHSTIKRKFLRSAAFPCEPAPDHPMTRTHLSGRGNLRDGLPELNGWGGWPRRRSYPRSGPRRFSLTIRARKAGGPNLRVRGGAGVEPETDVGPIGLCL